MGESVEVVTSELHLAADRLQASGQRLQDGLSSVDLETSNLLASGWKGEAATAFEKYWDQWHNGAGQVVRALQMMSEALDAAAKNYEATDEQAGGALESTMQGGGSGGTGGSGGAPSAGGSGGAPASGASGSESGSGSSTSGGSTGSSGGSAQQTPDLAQQMNMGQAMQPLGQAAAIPAQLAGQVTGGLMQAGTLAAGAAQQAVQMGMQIAEQAEAAAGEAEDEEAEKVSEDEGAAGGAVAAETAPVEEPRPSPLPESPTAREL